MVASPNRLWLMAVWLVTVVLPACAPLQPSPAVADDPVVYVIARGWHTDIGLSADSLTQPLARIARPFPGVRFLTFGFGERNYLLERRVTVATMLSAMLPSRSGMLITALSATPQAAFGSSNVIVLHISSAAFARVELRIWNEFQKSASGQPVWLADGPYPGSEFYGGVDTSYGLYTCNAWTADVLRAGGLPVPVPGVLFASQIMGMARWISAQPVLLPHR